MTYSYLLQTALKATNVFKQEHKVDRSTRGQTLGSGFRGCTIWFTGKFIEKSALDFFILVQLAFRHRISTLDFH